MVDVNRHDKPDGNVRSTTAAANRSRVEIVPLGRLRK